MGDASADGLLNEPPSESGSRLTHDCKPVIGTTPALLLSPRGVTNCLRSSPGTGKLNARLNQLTPRSPWAKGRAGGVEEIFLCSFTSLYVTVYTWRDMVCDMDTIFRSRPKRSSFLF